MTQSLHRAFPFGKKLPAFLHQPTNEGTPVSPSLGCRGMLGTGYDVPLADTRDGEGFETRVYSGFESHRDCKLLDKERHFVEPVH
jgi:hypothetical protein